MLKDKMFYLNLLFAHIKKKLKKLIAKMLF